MANKAIIYAIYPTPKQQLQCQKTFKYCLLVYNEMLTVQKERYKNGEKHLSKLGANNYCNQTLKKQYPFLKEVDKFALTNSIYNLENGFERFFKGMSKFPKYKKEYKAKKSYTTNFTNNNIAIGEGYIKLPKLGKVKAVIHRLPKEDWVIKSATIRQNPDQTYQVSILFQYEETPVVSMVDGVAKICQEEIVLKNEKLALKLEKKQRKLKRKVAGSNNYKKQKQKVAKLHRHIANRRKDVLHKTSTEMVKHYSEVHAQMPEGKIDDGYGMFLTMLEYKLKEKGGKLIKEE